MDLIAVIAVVAVVGFAVWLLVTYVPMVQPIKTILIGFASLIVFLWLLRVLFGPIHVPVMR